MSYSRAYWDQVDLLLKVLPVINRQNCFALKGGTAINLFIRDMPRLSVDIDLTYLPIEPRDQFLINITNAIKLLADNIKENDRGAYHVKKTFTQAGQLSKLTVSNHKARIIIEPNFVLRGAVFESEERELCQAAQDDFLSYFSIKTLSFADLYGGKICAALARQHPRDLFDVKMLLDHEGITEKVRQALVVYLASNSRPIHELLNPLPNLQNMEQVFQESFLGMTKIPVAYEELVEVRHQLIKSILTLLTENERRFLLSIKMGQPDWDLLPINGLDELPGLAWKKLNIAKMDSKKHAVALDNLKKILGL